MVRLVVKLVVALAVVVSMSPAPAQAGDLGQRAQRQLNQLGCQAGPTHGKIGPRTRAAVIRFQAANRLPQSGRLAQATRQRLFGTRQVACDDRPVPRSGAGRRVVISQRQNYVWLVRAGGKVVAEGGMVDNPRVLGPGSYRVGTQCGRTAKIRMNSDYTGAMWLPYFTRFAPCGVGFHQIPLHKSSGRQIHADWLLGTNLRTSHGCIRTSRTLADRLWTFTGLGTRVVVLG